MLLINLLQSPSILKLECQRGLSSAGKVCSLRLTSPGSIPTTNAPLLVGLRPGWHNTTIKAPIFISPKKKKKQVRINFHILENLKRNKDK